MNTVFTVHLIRYYEKEDSEYYDFGSSETTSFDIAFSNFDDAVQYGLYKWLKDPSYNTFVVTEITVFDNFESVIENSSITWRTDATESADEKEQEQKMYLWYNVADKSQCRKVTKELKF